MQVYLFLNTTTTNILNPQNHCNSTSLLAVTMTLRNKYFKQELLGVLLDLQRVCVISYYFITDHKVEICLRIHKGTTITRESIESEWYLATLRNYWYNNYWWCKQRRIHDKTFRQITSESILLKVKQVIACNLLYTTQLATIK